MIVFSPIISRDKNHCVIDNKTENACKIYLWIIKHPMHILLPYEHFKGKAILVCEAFFICTKKVFVKDVVNE